MILKIHFGKGGLGKGNGAALAPDVIEQKFSEIDSEEAGFEQLDLDVNEIDECHRKIEEKVASLNEKAILLGGDHSITYSAVKGFAKNHSEFKFIVFDAHPDLMEDFRPPTHESYLRQLIEDGVVKAENVFIVGTRKLDEQELEYIDEKGIKHLTFAEMTDKGVKEVMSELGAFADKDIYVSIDIDVIDPKYAPGTGYHEEFGLDPDEVMFFLRELKKTGKIAMADLVEVNPEKDVEDKTSVLAAKILAELKDF